eukprot:gene5874-biopygen13482
MGAVTGGILNPGLNHKHDPYGHVPPASITAPARDGGSLIHPCPAAPAAKRAAATCRIPQRRDGRGEGGSLLGTYGGLVGAAVPRWRAPPDPRRLSARGCDGRAGTHSAERRGTAIGQKGGGRRRAAGGEGRQRQNWI